MNYPSGAACPCAPCKAKELKRCERYILDELPIDGKIDKELVAEFRRLVSSDGALTFTEKLIELAAFSASTSRQQRELVHRVALEAREWALEDFGEAADYVEELDGVIAATEPVAILVELVRTA